jgi:hypothetical protein
MNRTYLAIGRQTTTQGSAPGTGGMPAPRSITSYMPNVVLQPGAPTLQPVKPGPANGANAPAGENFFIKYKKPLLIGGGALLLIVGAYFVMKGRKRA